MYELCKVEQDLAMGEDESGEKIIDAMSLTALTFFDKNIGWDTELASCQLSSLVVCVYASLVVCVCMLL